jgi:hypothetical protein
MSSPGIVPPLTVNEYPVLACPPTVTTTSPVVAPTGIAALNAGGQTIHSFCRFPAKDVLDDDDIKPIFDRNLFNKLDLLIIDEVSMVRCDIMDGIDKFLRRNRSPSLPYGGVQILLVGRPISVASSR